MIIQQLVAIDISTKIAFYLQGQTKIQIAYHRIKYKMRYELNVKSIKSSFFSLKANDTQYL